MRRDELLRRRATRRGGVQLSARRRALALTGASVGLVAVAWWVAVPGAGARQRRCEVPTVSRETVPLAASPTIAAATETRPPPRAADARVVRAEQTPTPAADAPVAPAGATYAGEPGEDPIVEGNVDLAQRALDLATLAAADAGDLPAREREYEAARRAQEARLAEAGVLTAAAGGDAGASDGASAPQAYR